MDEQRSPKPVRPGDDDDKGARLLAALRPALLMQFLAGNMLLQARAPLVVHRASSEEAKKAALASLANAASLGSLAELLLSPSLGRLSDRYGRRPLMLFHVLAPATGFVAVLLSRHSPAFAVRSVFADLFLTRGFGMQPLAKMAQVAVSDVFEKEGALADIGTMRGLSVVIGNLLGGWLHNVLGLEGPHLMGVLNAGISVVSIARMPETHDLEARLRLRAQRAAESSASEGGSSSGGGGGGSGARAVRTLLRDPETRSLALLTVLQEFTFLPQFIDVAILQFRDLLGWGSAEASRFLVAHGVVNLFGSWTTDRLIQRLGSDKQTSLVHACSCLAFALWGAARSPAAMLASLVPMTLSFGRGVVSTKRIFVRANELGLGTGEASAALNTLSVVAKILAPQFFLALYQASASPGAAARRQRRFRLPVGSPMFFMSALWVVCEVLHRQEVRARTARLRLAAS